MDTEQKLENACVLKISSCSTACASGLNVVMLLVMSAMVRGLKLNITAVE